MKNKLVISILLLLIITAFTACDGSEEEPQATTTTTLATSTGGTTTVTETTKTDVIDHSQQNEEIKELLPDREGYVWKYNGFAEYGHRMEIESIDEESSKTTYSILGEVDDMSGGESGLDMDMDFTYVIMEGKLFQYTGSGRQMDSTFKEMVLITTPLEEGNEWTQKAITREDVEVELDCMIEAVIDDGTYVVRYEQKDSNYYEVRHIRIDTGIILFERLFVSGADEFEIGYYLYDEISGYPEEISLKSILPPFDTELRYFGLAEYAHRARWDDTFFYPEKTIYEVNGSFEDGSGIPGDFKVHYILDRNEFTLTEKVIENTRSGEPFVNSIISDMIILKAPLATGNSWQQDVVIDGSEYMMQALITSTKIDDHNPHSVIYTVRYTIDGIDGYFNDRYIQERNFMTRRGMTGFSQLFPGDIGLSGKDLEDSYKVEQALINHMFGYSQDLTGY
jgi:hypothetical protein